MNDQPTPTIEVIRRVYDNGACAGGAYIEVGPDADGLSLVKVHTSAKSVEFFGIADLVMNPETALKLAEALIAAAGEAR